MFPQERARPRDRDRKTTRPPVHARHLLGFVAAVGIAYACGTRTHPFPMATAAAATNGASATNDGASHRAPAPTTLESTMDVSVSGEDVHFVMRVTNNTSKKLELTFPSGQTHDIAVVDGAGTEVWRWSTGQMFTQALRNQPLDPRGALSYSVHWRRPRAHGPLVAIATLTSSNYPLESRADFALP
jgi:Intracellular proteinase inhibitor